MAHARAQLEVASFPKPFLLDPGRSFALPGREFGGAHRRLFLRLSALLVSVCAFADTFASKAAALQDVYADASIGNVTGSNAVNVFLGIGLAWSVAAIYWAMQGQEFHVSAGTLAFSVTLFTIFAFVCISVLLYRRRPHLGGELGGPRSCKLATTWLFVSLWLLYVLFATLEAYCYIKGF